MPALRVMRPVATWISKLSIVAQVNIHLAQLIVRLRSVNFGTRMEMLWMVFIEDALTAQVRVSCWNCAKLLHNAFFCQLGLRRARIFFCFTLFHFSCCVIRHQTKESCTEMKTQSSSLSGVPRSSSTRFPWHEATKNISTHPSIGC